MTLPTAADRPRAQERTGRRRAWWEPAVKQHRTQGPAVPFVDLRPDPIANAHRFHRFRAGLRWLEQGNRRPGNSRTLYSLWMDFWIGTAAARWSVNQEALSEALARVLESSATAGTGGARSRAALERLACPVPPPDLLRLPHVTTGPPKAAERTAA